MFARYARSCSRRRPVRGSLSRRRAGAYTLIEMLVALIMFALISVATSFLLTGALRGQSDMRRQARDAQEARALLDLITRDLRSAFVVTGSPSTYFVASGADFGPILQFTTLASRLRREPVTSDPNEDQTIPQSGIVQVTYDFDPDTRVLSRLATTLPGSESYPVAGLPDWILSRRVQSLVFTFVDADGNVRNEWNFQKPTDESGGADLAGTYDTTLPVRVDVELELAYNDYETVLFRTSVALANAEPQPAGQTPPAPESAAGGGGAPPGDGGTGGGGPPGGGGGAP